MILREAHDYQPAVHRAAASIADEVRALLPKARVEHVGASSIPGAISKGDLDLCVVVQATRHAAAVQALEAAGYVVKADTLRTSELCMLLSPRTDLDIALQVVAAGSDVESAFLRFREALRASPSLVEGYNAVKRQAAGLRPEQYRDAKAAFIASVLARA